MSRFHVNIIPKLRDKCVYVTLLNRFHMQTLNRPFVVKIFMLNIKYWPAYSHMLATFSLMVIILSNCSLWKITHTTVLLFFQVMKNIILVMKLGLVTVRPASPTPLWKHFLVDKDYWVCVAQLIFYSKYISVFSFLSSFVFYGLWHAFFLSHFKNVFINHWCGKCLRCLKFHSGILRMICCSSVFIWHIIRLTIRTRY